jgi:hypothetical protein
LSFEESDTELLYHIAWFLGNLAASNDPALISLILHKTKLFNSIATSLLPTADEEVFDIVLWTLTQLSSHSDKYSEAQLDITAYIIDSTIAQYAYRNVDLITMAFKVAENVANKQVKYTEKICSSQSVKFIVDCLESTHEKVYS